MTTSSSDDTRGVRTSLPGAPADLDDGAVASPLPPAGDGPGPDGAEPPARSQWQLFRRRFLHHKLAVVGLVVLVLLYVLVFGASLWVPKDPRAQDILTGVQPPSREHWFGTDTLGRDYFARVIYAGQISLKIGMAVAVIATVLGTFIGALAGYFGRWVDQLLMRVTDLFLIIPAIAVLAVAVKFLSSEENPFGRFFRSNFGGTDTVIIVVLAALGWMQVARVVRGQVLAVKEKEFVEAARAVGASDRRIIMRHILPNCIGPIVVNATLVIAIAIVTESTLSFLGFGVQAPETSWGNMLEEARGNISFNEHLLYFPGAFILLTVLCVNFVGDGLRDAFDPQSRR